MRAQTEKKGRRPYRARVGSWLRLRRTAITFNALDTVAKIRTSPP